MKDAVGSKVVIRTAEGGYLAGGPPLWRVTQDCLKAAVFDYEADGVAEKLGLIKRLYDIVLTAVPVDSKEFFETCDRCDQVTVPQMIFFDGQQFLCPDCRTAAQRAEESIGKGGLA